jgi:hypothetical protein
MGEPGLVDADDSNKKGFIFPFALFSASGENCSRFER